MTAHKIVILHIELPPCTFNHFFFSITFFQIEEVAQAVPNLNHGDETLPGRIGFDRQRLIDSIPKAPGHLEDNFAALRLHTERAHLQRLEVVGSDEIFIELFTANVFRHFLSGYILHGRQTLETVLDFLAKVDRRRSHAVERVLKHAAGINHVADDLAGQFGKILVDDSRTCAAIFLVFCLNSGRLHPIGTADTRAIVLAEKQDVRGHVREGVLTKSRFRQTHGSQKIGIARDMFPCGRVCRIHEEATDHKGTDTARAQKAQRFCQKIVMDGEIAQFGVARIEESLFAEGRIAHHEIKGSRVQRGILKTGIQVTGMGIQIA